ncbi:MAG TPA: hypothetical protein VGB99_12555 [Acidobacteriota bacterium]
MVTRISITKPLAEQIRQTEGYVVLEADGVPVVGTMDIDEFEDYLELRDPQAREDIRKSREDILAGRVRPARELLVELRRESQRMPKRRSTR